jgi:tetraacyldisaccharide 4'-kinase
MEYFRTVMSGADRGLGASALRAGAFVIEPFYATGMRVRNRLFDAGLKRTQSLGRPTISVGNLTAGGTGKTPLGRWLADRLRSQGRHVAILARGYRSVGSEPGDEQRMLDAALNADGLARIELIANPDRTKAASMALARNAGIDVFILDDAFQHRRVRRDLDVVLISAPEPFGFDHVLPRGLLREPLTALKRAGAVVLTHCDQVSAADLDALERRVRAYHADVPVYRAVHAHVGLKEAAGERRPMDLLAHQPFYAFAGIGAPELFDSQLKQWGGMYRGHRWLADHFQYDAETVNDLRSAARMAGAEALVTTEKDWVKLAGISSEAGALPIWRIEMALQFLDDDESRFWRQIAGALGGPPAAPAGTPM